MLNSLLSHWLFVSILFSSKELRYWDEATYSKYAFLGNRDEQSLKHCHQSYIEVIEVETSYGNLAAIGDSNAVRQDAAA